MLRIDVSLVNPTNAALSVDAYFGLSVGNQIVALIPYGTIALPPSLKLFDLPQVSYTLTGAEPAGDYLSFTLLAQPGSDITNPANIINFDVAPFQIQ
jgi:hypothetical protein